MKQNKNKAYYPETMDSDFPKKREEEESAKKEFFG